MKSKNIDENVMTALNKLNYENCAIYFKMTNYLSEKHVKKSEYFRVRNDIIVMLYDAQERGENAEALFSEGYEKFLDDVAENCDKEKWYETLLYALFWLAGVFSIAMFLKVLLTNFLAGDGEWLSGVNINVGISGFISMLIAIFTGIIVCALSSKFTFKKFIFNKKLGFLFYAILIIAVAIGLIVVVCLTVDGKFISFNWVAVACGSLGGAIILRIVLFLIAKFSEIRNKK